MRAARAADIQAERKNSASSYRIPVNAKPLRRFPAAVTFVALSQCGSIRQRHARRADLGWRWCAGASLQRGNLKPNKREIREMSV